MQDITITFEMAMGLFIASVALVIIADHTVSQMLKK